MRTHKVILTYVDTGDEWDYVDKDVELTSEEVRTVDKLHEIGVPIWLDPWPAV